jgi:succinate dehydrogenase/fumarate reductase flavoprotein subunit
MAGLVAAAEARRLGARPAVWEKGDRLGGSMALSTGMIWRYRTFEDFRAQCPRGDPALQRVVFEHLDEDLDWLESLGAAVAARDTGNPRTVGRRFEPPGLVAALGAAAGSVELGRPARELPPVPLVLACGGFAANRALVGRHITREADSLLLRASPWSTGDGLALGRRAGAQFSAGLDEFYGRAMPAPPARIGESDFVELAQVYARHATVRNARGEGYVARTWSEIDVVQWMARQPGARAWFTVSERALAERVRERTVAEVIEAGREAGMSVRSGSDGVTVEVVAGITTTLGGIAIDDHARVAPGVFAAGADAGGISTGGYSSGLAGALVLGRIAARSAVAAAGRGERPRTERAEALQEGS